MRRHTAVILSVVLAAALHVDWHLARPLHHRLSLDWSHHWLITAAVFTIVASAVAYGSMLLFCARSAARAAVDI